jgi:hypothetical protein
VDELDDLLRRSQETAGGQTFCEWCQDAAPRIAQERNLRAVFPDNGTPGIFSPWYKKFGGNAPRSHYAVRNPDGTITDTTILRNIANDSGSGAADSLSTVPEYLRRFAGYDTFPPDVYDYLLGEWLKAIQRRRF